MVETIANWRAYGGLERKVGTPLWHSEVWNAPCTFALARFFQDNPYFYEVSQLKYQPKGKWFCQADTSHRWNSIREAQVYQAGVRIIFEKAHFGIIICQSHQWLSRFWNPSYTRLLCYAMQPLPTHGCRVPYPHLSAAWSLLGIGNCALSPLPANSFNVSFVYPGCHPYPPGRHLFTGLESLKQPPAGLHAAGD